MTLISCQHNELLVFFQSLWLRIILVSFVLPALLYVLSVLPQYTFSSTNYCTSSAYCLCLLYLSSTSVFTQCITSEQYISALLYILSVLPRYASAYSIIVPTQCITSVGLISQEYCTSSIYYLSMLHLRVPLYVLHILLQQSSSRQHYCTYSGYYLSILHLIALLYVLSVQLVQFISWYYCTYSVYYLSVTASPHSAPIPAQCITSVYIISLVVLYVRVFYLGIRHLTALLYRLSVFPRHTSSYSTTLHIQRITSVEFITQHQCAYSVYGLGIPHLTSSTLHTQCIIWVYLNSQYYCTYSVGRQETIRVALQIQRVIMAHNQMPKCCISDKSLNLHILVSSLKLQTFSQRSTRICDVSMKLVSLVVWELH